MSPSDARASGPAGSLPWLDRLKGFGLLWIFVNHAAEQTFGGPHIANPEAHWVPPARQLAELAPVAGHGLWDPLLNVFRWFGWTGDQGVALFIFLSGFGLTWGLLQRDALPRLPLLAFLRARLLRIYPAYWLAHLPFFATFLVTGFGLSIFAWQSWASLAGLRITPSSLYYFSPAWWYIGLALQLYLMFPYLWRVLRARGVGALCVLGILLPLVARGVALLTTHDWVDLWSRGGIGVSRLPEFVTGMVLANTWFARPEATEAVLRRGSVRLGAALLYLAAFLGSTTLLGMVVAPLFMLLGLFPFLFAVFGRSPVRTRDAFAWLGRHSYPLFLVHHPLLLKLMPAGVAGSALVPLSVVGRAAVGFGGMFVAGLGLEWLTARVEGLGGRLGARRVVLGLTAAFVLFGVALLGAELCVRRFAPLEVDGWGERASLRPHETFGWTLAPGRQTRLRWQTYDYLVSANGLGFPAPEPVEARSPGTLRVMTFGDAFTSAEGVDTPAAWPRLLEARLQARGPAEVQNFAVTGYGPDQFAALARAFLPRFRPDVLVMTFFVNDFADAETSVAAFQEEIGFARPLPEGPASVLQLAYLERFVELRIQDRWNAWRGAERVFGFGLGHFDKLLVREPAIDAAQQARVRSAYAAVAEAARAVGARVIVPLIPAAPQVCSRAALAYFPPAVDLNDPKYDLDRPQKLILPLLREAGFEPLDLRPVLEGLPECPYQPENMHWRASGHTAVAEAVAGALAAGRQGP